jgi:hypothetical protein
MCPLEQNSTKRSNRYLLRSTCSERLRDGSKCYFRSDTNTSSSHSVSILFTLSLRCMLRLTLLSRKLTITKPLEVEHRTKMWIVAQLETTSLFCAADGIKQGKTKESWIDTWNKLMLAVISRELAPVGCVRLTGFLSGRTKILFILLLEKGLSGDI